MHCERVDLLIVPCSFIFGLNMLYEELCQRAIQFLTSAFLFSVGCSVTWAGGSKMIAI